MVRRLTSLLLVAALVACGDAALAASLAARTDRPATVDGVTAPGDTAAAHPVDASPVRPPAGLPALPATAPAALLLLVLGVATARRTPAPASRALGARTGLTRDGPRAA